MEDLLGVVTGPVLWASGLSRVIFRSRTFKNPSRFCLCCNRWNNSDSFSWRLLLSSERYLVYRQQTSDQNCDAHDGGGRFYRTNSANDRFSA
jgi:hypothetical protein